MKEESLGGEEVQREDVPRHGGYKRRHQQRDNGDDDDDLDDFNALQAKVQEKAAKRNASGFAASQGGASSYRRANQPASVERPVVIDDFIRNFLSKLQMKKTMNIFQNEWHELQKKGIF